VGGETGFRYALVGGFVRFDTSHLGNSYWEMSDNYLMPSFQSLIANHVCSYQCFVSRGLDENDHCHFYFESDSGVPPQFRCSPPSILKDTLK
jgi:hypothetical protein